MNYRVIYESLIARARSRGRPAGYAEKHHVLPKSMGGGDEPSNLVWLTAREHFLAHWMLFLIHQNRSTAVAWGRMSRRGRVDHGFYSRNFERARRTWVDSFTGGNHPSSVAVMNLDTGEIFLSTKDAALSVGLSAAGVRSAIRANCRAAGYRWVILGKKPQEPARRGEDKKKPIRRLSDGRLFPSATDAAKEIGEVTPRTLANSARSGFAAAGSHWAFEGRPAPAFRSRSRKVVNVESGEIFDTYVDAAASVDRDPASLLQAIRKDRACAGQRFRWA